LKLIIIITTAVIIVLLLPVLGRYLRFKIFHFPQIKNTAPLSAWNLDHQSFRLTTVNNKSLESIYCAPANRGPLIIAVHGYENTVEKLIPICTFLSCKGYRSLLINTRNHGESDADGYSTIVQYIQDLQAAIRFNRNLTPADGRVILLGHSLGAAASLYLATCEPAVAAVIAIASFADLEQQVRRALRYHKFPAWIIPIMLHYLEFSHHIRIRDFSPQNSIARLKVPLLLLHGREDRLVPREEFELLQSSAPQKWVTARIFSDDDHSSLLAKEETFNCIYDFLIKNNLPG
jgi:alpha-beta hydrolase superfamily lysophospholipase